MILKILTLGSNSIYFFFFYKNYLCKYLQVNVYKNLNLVQYKMFFVDLYAYIISFCKIQTCNVTVFLVGGGVSCKYKSTFNPDSYLTQITRNSI